MKDRFGNPLLVAWAPHEDIWVEAATTLPQRERYQAFEDIASMTTRSFKAVYSRSNLLEQRRLDKLRYEKAARLQAERSRAWMTTPA